MKISSLCTSYLSGFEDLKKYKTNTKKENIIVALKIISYLSIILPVAALGARYLCDRMNNNGAPIPQDIPRGAAILPARTPAPTIPAGTPLPLLNPVVQGRTATQRTLPIPSVITSVLPISTSPTQAATPIMLTPSESNQFIVEFIEDFVPGNFYTLILNGQKEKLLRFDKFDFNSANEPTALHATLPMGGFNLENEKMLIIPVSDILEIRNWAKKTWKHQL